jgi:hypothetical protein
VLRHLALVQPILPDASPLLSAAQTTDQGAFRIVVTTQRRGSIPAEVWNSSYVVFAAEAPA